jgi:predicted MFS family arabinose efflux permease
VSEHHKTISSVQLGFLMSVPFFATMFGALLVAVLAPIIGRKTLCVFGMILLVISNVIVGSAFYEAHTFGFCAMIVLGGFLRGLSEAFTV